MTVMKDINRIEYLGTYTIAVVLYPHGTYILYPYLHM